MKNIALLLQIGELFKGNFNWHGVLHLFLFLLMGSIFIGFSAFIAYKALGSNNKK